MSFLTHPIAAFRERRERKAVLRERRAFVERLASTPGGRGFLQAAIGEKAISGTSIGELVAGPGWFAGIPLSKMGDYSSYLTAGTKLCWALFRCASLIANEASQTKRKLMVGDGSGKDREWNGAGVEELKPLMRKPNEWLTWEDLSAQTYMRLVMMGNDFWAKDEGNGRGQKPARIIPMNPKRMSIVIDTRSGPVGYIYRPVYGQDRGDYSSAIPFTMNEVIHFRLPNPANDHWGLGPVEASEPLFNDFINEDTWRQSYWRRGALPTTLIIGGKTSTQFDFPGGAAGWDQMKAKWESDYGGTANAGKTAFLYGDWDVKTMGLSLDEMQALETRRWTVESIANVCGVPLSVFGLQSAANYATAAIDRRAFLRDAVLPYVRRFEQQVTAGLIEGYNPQAKLVHEVSGLISLEELVPPVVQAISVGLLTPNEGREVIGKEKVEDENMDKHYITAGLQPMEMSGAADLGLVDQQAQALQARAQSGEAFRPKPRGDIKPGEVALAKPPSAVPGNGQPKRPTKA